MQLHDRVANLDTFPEFYEGSETFSFVIDNSLSVSDLLAIRSDQILPPLALRLNNIGIVTKGKEEFFE